MVYRSFDEQITWKHGIVVEGWPLPKFENPSAVGSQLELRTLFNAWQSGAACFHKMPEDEFLSWITNRHEGGSPSTAATPSVTVASSSSTIASHDGHTTHTPPPTSATPAFNFVEFDLASPTPLVGVQKKARKTRSDKGKPQKRGLQLSGELVFPETQ